jgi:prolipoprotein diacylglyceryltransferase
MEHYLIISANGPYFNLFYNLAFAIALLILLYEGYVRKFPMMKWVLLLLISKIFIIMGSKLITYSSADWNYLLTNLSLPATTDKSMFGSLIFGTISLIAGKYLLGFRRNFIDAFALVLPLTLGIMRVGCFLTGCCFGRISELPWAVQYPANTLPHFHQFEDGLLTYMDYVSLPVHPVQLYELILLAAAVFILVRFRNRFKRPGSLLILSLILLLVVRFFIEFFRDVNAHTVGGQVIWIFNFTQLFIIPVTALLIYGLIIRELRSYTRTNTVSDFEIQLLPAFLILFLLSSVFWSLKGWWDYPEVIAILLVFVFAISIFTFKVFRSYYLSPYRWIYLTSLVLPVLLMSQAYPDYQKQLNIFNKYKSVKIGFATGHFENSHNIGTGEGCDRVSMTEYFDQKYILLGGGFETTEYNRFTKEQLTYGIKGYLGNHQETRLSDNFKKENFLIGITPYSIYEKNWIGIGGGLHLGNLSFITENLREEGSGVPKSGSKEAFIYPQLYLRVGPRNYFYIEYRLADQFPSALPGFRHQIGAGTGLGDADNFTLRVGLRSVDSYYIGGKFTIDNKYVFEPQILIGDKFLSNQSARINQFSMGLSYRFDFKEKQGKP